MFVGVNARIKNWDDVVGLNIGLNIGRLSVWRLKIGRLKIGRLNIGRMSVWRQNPVLRQNLRLRLPKLVGLYVFQEHRIHDVVYLSRISQPVVVLYKIPEVVRRRVLWRSKALNDDVVNLNSTCPSPNHFGFMCGSHHPLSSILTNLRKIRDGCCI